MFTFDDEFGLFDEDVIFNNEDILHEAPNDDNKKENKGQNGSGDNTDSTEDDAPTDYTDGSESPNTPVDDEGNPDYTEEEEPDYDEESGNDPENDQTKTDSESDDTNTEVKSDEGDGETTPDSDTDGNIDDTNTEGTDDDSDSPDYTSEEDPSAAEGEPGDDADGAGDEEAGDDMGGEDTTDDASGDTTEGGDGEISQLQNDLFSNLSDEQMKLRINSIKDSFIELYSNVDNTSKQILLVNRSSDNIVAINYINETLGALKDMIRDALTVSFGTRSIAENQIVLQKLVAIYSLVYKIVEKIGNRKEEK